MSGRAPRGGYVLVVVLLLLLVVTATGHGLLTLSRAELAVSLARWDALERRLSAASGVRRGASGIPNVDALAPGDWTPALPGTVPPRGRYATRALRIASELILLRSDGSLVSRPGVHTLMGVYWGMSPERRVGDAAAIVESAGLEIGAGEAGVRLDRIRGAPPGWSEERCEPYRTVLDTLLPGGVPEWATLSESPLASTDPTRGVGGTEGELPDLGLLDHEALMAGASVRVTGTVSPRPERAAARCERSDAHNWGAPLKDRHPCADYRPVIASEGRLEMVGGSGQGVLLVAGDLVLASSARFFGVVLVSGDVSIEGGARISGLLRARGTVRLDEGGTIVGSACAALAVLHAAEALRGLIALPEGAWLQDRG